MDNEILNHTELEECKLPKKSSFISWRLRYRLSRSEQRRKGEITTVADAFG